MSRYRSEPAYGQRLQRIGHDHYRMHWVVDYYYATSRQRHPRGFSRDTDEAGARRFAKKHGLPAPSSEQTKHTATGISQ